MSFPRYEKYKDSGVERLGEVPEHWQLVPAKRRIRSQAGGASIKGSCADVAVDGLYPGFSASGQDVWLEAYDFDVPGVVLSAVGARCGKTFKADGLWSVVANTHCLFPLDDDAHRDFIWYLTNNESWWEKGGTAQPFVKVSESLARKWVFPPREEQAAIANFLDRETAKIDALVEEQKRLIELLKEKRQAVISQAVTKGLDPSVPMKDSGVEWLGGVPAHWEVRRVSSISTKITNGYVGPTRDILVDHGVRYLQSLHIKANRIKFDTPYFVTEDWSKEHRKSILQVGDLLIVQTGDIGQVAVVTDEFAGCNCHALIIVSPLRKVVAGEYLGWVFGSDYGKHSLLSIQTGALHPHLNCGNVKDLVVPLPPPIEQAEILKRCYEAASSFDALITEAQAAVELLSERRSALISAAVTGKIDVRGLVPQPEVIAA